MGKVRKIVDGVMVEVEEAAGPTKMVRSIENGVMVEKPFSETQLGGQQEQSVEKKTQNGSPSTDGLGDLQGGQASLSSGDNILDNIYQKYPALRSLGETTLKADTNFTRDKTGVGSIEYFSPEQGTVRYGTGLNTPHPKLGTHGIVYNPNENTEEDIMLDMLHGMSSVPEYNKLREKFKTQAIKDRGGDARHFYEKEKKEGKAVGDEQAWLDNYVDGLIRSEISTATEGDYALEREGNSPEMKSIASDIKNFLSGEVSEPANPFIEFEGASEQSIQANKFSRRAHPLFISDERKAEMAAREKEVLKDADGRLSKAKAAINDQMDAYTTELDFNLDQYTEKDISDLTIADTEKLAEFARQKAVEGGFPEDGHAAKYIWNKAKEHVNYKILEPELQAEVKKIHKEKYGALPKKQLEQLYKIGELETKANMQMKAADEEITAAVLQESRDEVFGILGAAGDVVYQGNEEAFKATSEQISQKYADKINPAGEFMGSEQEFAAYKQENETAYNDYKRNFDKILETVTNSNALANRKYRKAMAQRQDEVNRGINAEIEKRGKLVTPFMQKRMQKVYQEAAANVNANKETLAKFADNEIAEGRGDLSLYMVSTLAPYVSSLGSSVKAISSTVGSRDGEILGDYFQNKFNFGDVSIKEWTDLLNARKLLSSTGQLAGTMTTSMVPAILAGAATGGAGAVAILAGGATGAVTETMDLAGRMYDDSFAETGDAGIATKRSKQTVDSQLALSWSYGIQMVPFFGKAASNMVKSVARGAVIEGVVETVFQEYPQNIVEQAIKDDKSITEAYKYASWEKFNETAMNTAPILLFGGVGGARGYISEQNQKAQMELNVKTLSEKLSMGELTEDMKEQTILKMNVQYGKKFAQEVISMQYNDGRLSEEEAKRLIGVTEYFEKARDQAVAHQLPDNRDTYVLSYYYGKLSKAMSNSEAEQDPVAKRELQKKVSAIQSDIDGIIEDGDSRYVTLEYSNGDFAIMNYSELQDNLKKESFVRGIQLEGVKMQVRGSGQEEMAQLISDGINLQDNEEAFLKETEVFKQEKEKLEAAQDENIDFLEDNPKAYFQKKLQDERAQMDEDKMEYHIGNIRKYESILQEAGEKSKIAVEEAKAKAEEATKEKPKGEKSETTVSPVSQERLSMLQEHKKKEEEEGDKLGMVDYYEKQIDLLQNNPKQFWEETLEFRKKEFKEHPESEWFKEKIKEAEAELELLSKPKEPKAKEGKKKEAPKTDPVDDLVDRAREGDTEAIAELDEHALEHKKNRVYRFVGGSEVDALINGERIEGKNKSVGVDVTNSENVTSATDADHRVTFKDTDEFDDKKSKSKVRRKNEEDGWVPGGYDLNDVEKIEKKNEQGEWEEIYSEEAKKDGVKDISDQLEGGKVETIGDTEIVYIEEEGKIVMESVKTAKKKRGKGSARKAMEKFNERADKEGLVLEGRIAPEDKSTSKEELARFYEDLGYVVDGDKVTRQPVKKKAKKATTETTELTIKTRSDKKGVTPAKVVKIKGWEIFDTVVVQKGLMTHVIELTTGQLLGEGTTEAEAIKNAKENLSKGSLKEGSKEALMDKIFGMAENSKYTNSPVKKINESESHTKWLEKRNEEVGEDLFSEEQKAELISIADKMDAIAEEDKDLPAPDRRSMGGGIYRKMAERKKDSGKGGMTDFNKILEFANKKLAAPKPKKVTKKTKAESQEKFDEFRYHTSGLVETAKKRSLTKEKNKYEKKKAEIEAANDIFKINLLEELEAKYKERVKKITKRYEERQKEEDEQKAKFGEKNPDFNPSEETEQKEEVETEPTGKKATGIKDLYNINREMFGLDRVKSFANAIVMDRMISQMAKRKGVAKAKIYETIEYRKGDKTTEQNLRDLKASFQGKDGKANFDKWTEGAEVVEGHEVFDEAKTGKPIVMRLYHGTTHAFYEFDSSVKGQTGGHLGKVNYFTTDEQDASQNYQSDGMDLAAKIENEKEQLDQIFENNYNEFEDEIENLAEDFGYTVEEMKKFTDYADLARDIAEKRHTGGEDMVLETWVKLRNPAVIGGGQNWVDLMGDEWSDARDEAIDEIADENDVSKEEAQEEFEDEINERVDEKMMYVENPLMVALEKAISDNIYDWEQASTMASEALDGFYESEVELGQLEKAIREGTVFAENEESELSTAQIVSDFFKNLGYDGIILKDVSQRFSGMNIGGSTSHIHVFDEFSNQIKLADGSNVEFGTGKDIRFQNAQGAMIMEDGKAIIYALTDPNVSTPIHELAHVFEHYLTDSEIKSILDWSEAEMWSTDVSENFTRGFEKFLAEGIAPTPQLRKLFQKFKEWLMEIYNGLKGSAIDLELNEPMRKIYSAMLGADEMAAYDKEMKDRSVDEAKVDELVAEEDSRRRSEAEDERSEQTKKENQGEWLSLNEFIHDHFNKISEKDFLNFGGDINALNDDKKHFRNLVDRSPEGKNKTTLEDMAAQMSGSFGEITEEDIVSYIQDRVRERAIGVDTYGAKKIVKDDSVKTKVTPKEARANVMSEIEALKAKMSGNPLFQEPEGDSSPRRADLMFADMIKLASLTLKLGTVSERQFLKDIVEAHGPQYKSVAKKAWKLASSTAIDIPHADFRERVRTIQREGVAEMKVALKKAAKSKTEAVKRAKKEQLEQFKEGFNEYVEALKSSMKERTDKRVQAYRDKLADFKKSIREQKSLDKTQVAEMVKAMRKAIRESDLVFSKAQVSRVVGLLTGVTPANIDAKTQKVLDYLDQLENATRAKELKRLAAEIKKKLKVRTHLSKGKAGKRVRSFISPEVQQQLSELAREFSDKIDGMDEMSLIQFNDMVDGVLDEGKIDQKTIQALRKKAREGLRKRARQLVAEKAGVVTELTGEKRTLENVLKELSKPTGESGGGNAVIINGNVFLPTKEDRNAVEELDEAEFVDGNIQLIPLPPKSALAFEGRSLSTLMDKAKGLFFSKTDLRTLPYLLMGDKASQEWFMNNLIRPAIAASNEVFTDRSALSNMYTDLKRKSFGTKRIGNKGNQILGAKSGIALKSTDGDNLIEDLTNDEITYLYNALKDPDVYPKLLEGKISIDGMKDIIEYVNNNPDLKAYADGLIEIYETYLPKVNKAIGDAGYQIIEPKNSSVFKEALDSGIGTGFDDNKQLVQDKIDALEEELADAVDPVLIDKLNERISKLEEKISNMESSRDALEKMKEVYELMYGSIDAMPEVVPYSPVSVSQNDATNKEAQSLFAEKGGDMPSIMSNNVIERRKGGSLNVMNAETMFANYLESMVNMTNKIGLYEDLFAMFKEGDGTMRLIEQKWGKVYAKTFQQLLKNIVMEKNVADNSEATWAERWVNRSQGVTLFANFRSAIFQAISGPNFFIDAITAEGLGVKYLGNAVTPFSKEMKEAKQEIINSGWFQSRINQTFITELKDLSNDREAQLKWLDKTLTAGFAPNRFMDSNVTIALAGAPLYAAMKQKLFEEKYDFTPDQNKTEAENDKAQKKAEESAMKKAQKEAMDKFSDYVNQSQQSAEQMYRSLEQNHSIARMFLVFGSVSLLYTRKTIRAAADITNGRVGLVSGLTTIGYYIAVQNMLFHTLQQGILFAAGGVMAMIGGDDEDDEKYKGLDEDEKKELIEARKKGDKKEASRQGLKIMNASINSFLRGLGVYGAITAVVKDVTIDGFIAMAPDEEKTDIERAYHNVISYGPNKKSGTRVMLDALNQAAPAIGIKISKGKKAFDTLVRAKEDTSKSNVANIYDQYILPTALSTEVVFNIPYSNIDREIQAVRDVSNENLNVLESFGRLSGIYDSWTMKQNMKRASDMNPTELQSATNKLKANTAIVEASEGNLLSMLEKDVPPNGALISKSDIQSDDLTNAISDHKTLVKDKLSKTKTTIKIKADLVVDYNKKIVAGMKNGPELIKLAGRDNSTVRAAAYYTVFKSNTVSDENKRILKAIGLSTKLLNKLESELEDNY